MINNNKNLFITRTYWAEWKIVVYQEQIASAYLAYLHFYSFLFIRSFTRLLRDTTLVSFDPLIQRICLSLCSLKNVLDYVSFHRPHHSHHTFFACAYLFLRPSILWPIHSCIRASLRPPIRVLLISGDREFMRFHVLALVYLCPCLFVHSSIRTLVHSFVCIFERMSIHALCYSCSQVFIRSCIRELVY